MLDPLVAAYLAVNLEGLLTRSSRICILLSMLIPVMVISGGCIGLVLSKGIYNFEPGDCCRLVIADDPSYRDPPYDMFWKWFPRVSAEDPTSGERLLNGYIPSVDRSSITAELRKYLRDDARATAPSFFSSLGMSCRSAGSDAQCERVIPAYYVCVHTTPRPDDYKVRYEGRVRIAIWMSNNDVIKGADSTLIGRSGPALCPVKRE
jgi:hypothetical protein